MAAYEHYTIRLSAEVPIDEALARRDVLRGRLERLRRLASQVDRVTTQGENTSSFVEAMAALGLKSHSELDDALARDAAQLREVEQGLVRDLQKYAGRFGEPLQRQGKSVLEVVLREQRAQAAFSSIEGRLRAMEEAGK